MNIEEFRDFCLSLPKVTESFPFDEKTLVFKVGNKMFALADVDNFSGINVKCDPEKAIDLREKYQAVQPGYHMSKIHWNTLVIDGSLSDRQITEWIKDSYDLIVNSLPKKVKKELGLLC